MMKKTTKPERGECSNAKKKLTKPVKDECSSWGVSLVLVTVVICLRVRTGSNHLFYIAQCLETENKSLYY